MAERPNGAVKADQVVRPIRPGIMTDVDSMAVAREKISGRIVLILLATFVVVVVATLGYIGWFSLRFAEVGSQISTSILQTVGSTILAPLLGLIGAVIGFYFGGQTAVQAASQTAQATRTASEAATQAAIEAAQTPSRTGSQTDVSFDGQTFEPLEFANILVGEVIPDLRRRVDRDQTTEATPEDVSIDREKEAEALFEATRVLAPPPSVARPGVTYGILAGMVAVRAAKLDNTDTSGNSSPSDRYVAAQQWVCDNFSELIWWDCD